MTEAGGNDRDPEMLRLYWQTQWDRVGRLEDQRLQFSNFVIAASVVAIGVNVASEGLSGWAVALVALTVAAANGLAGVYGSRTEKWVAMHRRRSELLLDENWPYLAGVIRRVGRPDRLGTYGDTLKLHLALHIILTVAAVALAGIAVAGW